MSIRGGRAIKVMPIVGVRPQIIKSAPILHLLNVDEDLELQLIHSGQHYDFEMSKVFFNELDLPDPLRNLGIGSGSQATQTARAMMQSETVIRELKPDIVMVFGDANTTLGGALAATKLHVPVCHVEAGLRSYDIAMPEETNRVLTDHCSQMLCAPTTEAANNLQKEGIGEDSILLSGDTMYDAFLQHRTDIENSTVTGDLGLTDETYIVLTVHRQENVDDKERLTRIISAITKLTEAKTVFPVHPRTKKRLRSTNLDKALKQAGHVIRTEPLSYFDMLCLMKNAAVVLTDSGGMQKEAFLLHVPCVTLRYNTEWVETVKLGANKLAGAEEDRILREARRFLENKNIKMKLKSLPNPYGKGKASHNIVENLKERFHSRKLVIKPSCSILRLPSSPLNGGERH